MDNLDEFVKDFVVESQDGLLQLESDLVALEEDPQNTARLDSIFRVLHTIKGSSGFLSFEKLRELSHLGETLLGKLRSRELALSAPITNALFELVDAIRAMLDGVQKTRAEGAATHEDLKATLVRLAEPGAVGSLAPGEAKSKDRVSPQTTPNPVEPATPVADNSGKFAETADYPPNHESKVAEVPIRTGPVAADSSSGFAETAPFLPNHDAKVADLSIRTGPLAQGHAGDNSGGFAETAPYLPTADSKAADVPIRTGPVAVAGASQNLAADHLRQQAPHTSPVAAQTEHRQTSGPVGQRGGPEGPVRQAEATDADREASKSKPTSGLSSSNIRVDVDLLDHLMNLVGELVLTRNRMLQITSDNQDPDLLNTIQRLSQITSDLQDGTMKTRMQQIGTMWQKIPRIVRDVAGQCGKKVQLEMEGTQTELDKSLIEALNDPMLHLVRNAIDHGIENSGTRRAAGKPEQGLLSLRAFHQGGRVIIEISDDGAGLDVERIRQKALQRGVFSFDESLVMSADEIQASIFLPGFSTSERITNVSGRGVGMDVVKTNIERIGGTVHLKSRMGEGTTVRITVPLTLAIIPALIVTCAGDRYAIPQVNVVELLRLNNTSDHARIERVHDASVLRLRGKLLPLINLTQLLQVDEAGEIETGASTHVAVLRAGDGLFSLVVDAVVNTQEIVVKPLSQALKTIGVYAGSTIMGDGGIALILDALGLGRRAGLFTGEDSSSAARDVSVARPLATDQTLLICEVNAGRRIGIPLRQLMRIDEISQSAIERSSNREVVQCRGEIMPLIRLGRLLEPGRDTASERNTVQVVVHREAEREVGLVVDRVLDILEIPDVPRVPDGAGMVAGAVAGTAVLLDRVTDIIDVDALIRQA